MRGERCAVLKTEDGHDGPSLTPIAGELESGWNEASQGARTPGSDQQTHPAAGDSKQNGFCNQLADHAASTLPRCRACDRNARLAGLSIGAGLAAIAAAKEADAGRIFIAGDDNDWPKELYAKLGFDRLGREWEFIRWPEGMEGS